MKPRTDLLVNSVCLFLLSPLLGMMAAGLVVGVIEGIMWTIATVAGLISGIFFDIDFTTIHSRIPAIRQIEMWLIFGGGTIGGMVWGIWKIKEKWQKHELEGRGW
jgi:hypothetical protein